MGRSDITFEPVQDDGGLQARLESAILTGPVSPTSDDLRLACLAYPGAGAKHS